MRIGLRYTLHSVRDDSSFRRVQREAGGCMPEILTESFCERCGTRYTFESAAPKAKRLGRFKVLSQGLKNFVMSDDSSLDEALAAARNDEEREAVAQQLDAFHKTFNFCMNCRQYTCSNCWNEAEGRCLTCAPHLGHDILPAAFPRLGTGGNGTGTDGASLPDSLAWPTSDLQPPASASLAWPDGAEAAGIDAGSAMSSELPEWATAGPPQEPLLPDEPALPDDGWLTDVEARLGGASPLPQVEPLADVAGLEDVEPSADVERPADGEEPPAEESTTEFAANAETPVDEVELAPEPAAPSAETGDVAAADEARSRADQVEIETVDAATLDEAGATPAPAASQPATEPPSGPIPQAAAEPAPEPAPVPAPVEDAAPAVEERAAAAAATTAKLLARFRPGQSIDAALEEYEAALAAQESDRIGAAPASGTEAPIETPAAAGQAQPVESLVDDEAAPTKLELEPVAAGELDVEPLAETPTESVVQAPPEPIAAQAEPVAAETEPVSAETEPVAAEPEPVAAEPEPVAAEPEPIATVPAPAPPPAAAPAPAAEPVPGAESPRDDRVEVPVWSVVAPDVEAPATNGRPAEQSLPTAASGQQPEWPAAPAWPSTEQQVDVSFLAARLSRKPSNDALWAASSRDVVAPLPQQPAPPAVQTCVSCGLSLSATARFCRRCGSRQGG